MAWTGVESRKLYNNGNCEITVLLTADASAGTYDIDTYLGDIKGKFLYSMKVVPGAGAVSPDNTYDLDILDGDSFIILDTDANSATATVRTLGNATLTQYPMIQDVCTISVADMGAAGNQTTVHLVFVDRVMI